VLSDSELELDNGTTGSSTRRPATPGPPPPQGPSNPWPRRVLQVPLAAAAALSKEDAHYLAKRGRTRWWRTAQFPRVPGETDPKQPPELQARLCCRFLSWPSATAWPALQDWLFVDAAWMPVCVYDNAVADASRMLGMLAIAECRFG
jgi:hypothetical protein